VDLVVARGQGAIGAVDEAAVAHAVVAARHAQGQRPAHEPDAVALCGLGQALLDRAGLARAGHRPGRREVLGHGELVRVAPAHQAEVLGQRDELGARRRRFGHETAGRLQVARDLRGRNHLHGGDLHAWIVRQYP
jgi:hypothetical protein